jgi:RNAse (barnase) inhibitor barstar
MLKFLMRMANPTTKKVYVVDASRFSTLVETAAEFTRVLGLTMPWNGNLDAFNDFLHGGFGTPDQGFVLVWRHSEVSRQRLGYGETLRWLEENVQHCHPSNIADVQKRIVAARRQEGETLFDILVSIIRDHKDIELGLE